MVGWIIMLMAAYLPESLQDDVRILGLVLLLYAAVAWVRHRVGQAEMRTAEKLLEVEPRLAQLCEALERRAESRGTESPPA
jgi:hypothetical protein